MREISARAQIKRRRGREEKVSSSTPSFEMEVIMHGKERERDTEGNTRGVCVRERERQVRVKWTPVDYKQKVVKFKNVTEFTHSSKLFFVACETDTKNAELLV